MEAFIILVLTHFISDWIFQPTAWALTKEKNWKPRILHGLQYALVFLPVLMYLKISLWWMVYLAATHFIVDSRDIVNLWHKHYTNRLSKDRAPFFVSIVDDQIIHILLLLPLVI